ncbi:alpha/beta fold hydrolase [Bacillus infantis]|uniref:alpha/beta fold hydrolase n=1 Tax=Bacillus infantis TaxID=324767 RepID=UPI003CFB21F7
MPRAAISDHLELYYEDSGSGTPVIFIHGVWMSSAFFRKQLGRISGARTIAVDMRGHGKSGKPHSGHTISSYARDLHDFMEKLELKEVVLAGWSMGAFVVWEYIKQFGEENLKGTIIVDELPSDFRWPDFPIGAFDMPTLIHFMQEIQNKRREFVSGFLPLMFKETIAERDFEWMMDAVTAMPESIASSILFDQSIVDYRELYPALTKPSLLCYGREEKLIPVAAGQYIQEHSTDTELVIFEDSCHAPSLKKLIHSIKRLKVSLPGWDNG